MFLSSTANVYVVFALHVDRANDGSVGDGGDDDDVDGMDLDVVNDDDDDDVT